MKLYVTMTSPYARMPRAMLIEKQLEKRVDVVPAQTRTPDSPYYSINPSGRVPYLVTEDGRGFEGSQLICDILDRLDGAPRFAAPADQRAFEYRRLDEAARSLLDGLSVGVRERLRLPEDRSATIIEQERQREARLADFWETEIGHPMMTGAFNMPQLTLACALLMEQRSADLHWRKGRPGLSAWADRMAVRPSLAQTCPP